MKFRDHTRAPKPRSHAVAITSVFALSISTFMGAIPAQAGLKAEITSPVTQPQTIPSLDGWDPSEGTYSLPTGAKIRFDGSNDQLESIAEIFGEELRTIEPTIKTHADAGPASGPEEIEPASGSAASSAAPGDIEITMDPSRTDLGAEGYDITIDDTITITGAQYSGVFYGTRTLLQWLDQQTELPAGHATDIPTYEERGVTLCACVINISTEFIDRLIEEMAFLKLNTLMVELKVKVDEYPETNTWSYYTKEDIHTLVTKANAYGIDVIPEINSPGHMEIWLENLPDLQLTNQNTGKKDEVRMDITKDESFEFYTDLIDEYSQVFTSDYWHMGMDEYMLGSGYANYPQIKQFAQAQWGAGATEDDVVAWYSNKINAYVKSKGKTLRVWNDGIIRNSQIVTFDTDIIVENWNNAASSVQPQTFVNWGHDVVNVSNALYMVRGGYGINSANLYGAGNWNVNKFYNGTVTSGLDQVRGARLSLWPDGGTPAEAENTTEERLFEPLRFVSQMTWSTTRTWETYTQFKSAMDEIGRPPLWHNAERQPLPNGAYEVTVAAGAAETAGALAAGTAIITAQHGSATLGTQAESLTFAKTSDGYYTIKNSAGQCLDVSRSGTMRLDVPVEIGADITFSTCANTTIHRWQVRKVSGGYTIVNAASQQHVSVSQGLVNVPVAGKGFKDVPDGQLVQTPGDWGQTVWAITGGVSLAPNPHSVTLENGGSAEVSLTVTNTSATDIAGAKIRVAAVPEGWTVTPTEQLLPAVNRGDSNSAQFEITNVSGTEVSAPIGFELLDASSAVLATASTSGQTVCAAGTIRPAGIASVSSEQLTGEPAPNGPAAAAIDGNPGTYWHSAWSPSEATYPHSIVVDLGSAQEVCGLWYTARSSAGSGGANGRIAEYSMYVSDEVSTVEGAWGDPVAEGTFENIAAAQLASFAPANARYVKLVARTEVNGNVWATIGELAVAGPYTAPAQYTPEISLDVPVISQAGSVELTGSGFAAHEIVKITLGSTQTMEPEIALEAIASAAGGIQLTVAIPQDLALGEYEVVARGWASRASTSQMLTVVEQTPVEPEPTDPPESVPALTHTTLTAGPSFAGTPTVLRVITTAGPETDPQAGPQAGSQPELVGTFKILQEKKLLATILTSDGAGEAEVILTPGKHTLVASFTPDDPEQLTASTSTKLVVVTAKAKATVTAVLSAFESTYGQSESVSVAIESASSTLTGKVSVVSGRKTLATKKVSGSARLVVVDLPKLAVGEHALTVTYSGDASVDAASGSAGTLVVGKQDSASSLKVSSSGTSVTALVKGQSALSGKVQLFLDGKKVATKKLSSGKASFSVKKPKAGSHVYVVEYLGDANTVGSSANATVKLR